MDPRAHGCRTGHGLFAIEAYTFDEPVRYHLDYATVRARADQMATDRLVLTHMSPAMLERLVEADHAGAYDGLTVEF